MSGIKLPFFVRRIQTLSSFNSQLNILYFVVLVVLIIIIIMIIIVRERKSSDDNAAWHAASRQASLHRYSYRSCYTVEGAVITGGSTLPLVLAWRASPQMDR